MRLVVLTLLLALVLGAAQAMPLQGGNENTRAVLFGSTRVSLGDQNATEEGLMLDAALGGAENATYKLVDSKDNTYQPSSYRPLQPGRQMLFFLVPKDTLFKYITVTPTAGSPFNVNWWATPKVATGDLIIRYYGITDWLADPDQQALVMQLSLTNNGTTNLSVNPTNVTLMDQWGWSYYPVAGFEPMTLEPKSTTGRVLVAFLSISPLSRPSALAYDYGEPDQAIIDLDRDLGPLSDELAYGANASRNASAAAPVAQAAPSQAPAAAAPALTENQPAQAGGAQPGASAREKASTLKDEINATKERLGTKEGSNEAGSSAVGDKTRAGVEDAKKRLEMMKKGLSSDYSEI